MPRGILATVTAARPHRRTPTRPRRCSPQAYADEPFVHVLPEGAWPHTAATARLATPATCRPRVDVDSGRVIVVSAIDNLGKGAAGQAVQCANLMLGLPETTGLTAIGAVTATHLAEVAA